MFSVRPVAVHPGPVALICVASLLEVKGHTYLIQACRLLQQQGVDFICHLLGEGPYRARLEQEIADYGLSGRIAIARRPDPGPGTRITERSGYLRTGQRPDPARRPRRHTGGHDGSHGYRSAGSCQSSVRIPELVHDGVSGILTPPGNATALATAIATLIRDSGAAQ